MDKRKQPLPWLLVASLVLITVDTHAASEAENNAAEESTAAKAEGKIKGFGNWLGGKMLKADKKVKDATGAPPPSGMEDETINKQLDFD